MTVINGVKVLDFTAAYLKAALQELYISIRDDNSASSYTLYDRGFKVDDFSEKSISRADRRCRAFIEFLNVSGLLEDINKIKTSSEVGYDLWLTHNKYPGGGYWDNSYGERLSVKLVTLALYFPFFCVVDDNGILKII